MKMIGLLQEIAIVVWALAAAWILWPGGVAATVGACVALVAGAVAIVGLALVRRARTPARRVPARSPMLG